MDSLDDKYPGYQVFKGLQRPLRFLIFDGRYIGWAVATAAIGLIGFIVIFILFGMMPAFIFLGIALGTGMAKIFLAMRKGLYAKKIYKGTFMFVHLRSALTRERW